MIETLPLFVSVIFCVTVLLTTLFLYFSARRSTLVLLICVVWLAIQAVLAFSGFYLAADGFPPRIALMLLPPVLLILFLFVSEKGRSFIDNLDTKALTLLHIVRVPVEMVLYWLCLQKFVSQLMTFEGRNFDIFSGITAPLIYYFGLVKQTLNKKVIIAWNIICLGLVLNVVVHGILSVPTAFQQFAFDQPNIAMLYVPFCWLPAFVVPVVIFSHLVCLRRLFKK